MRDDSAWVWMATGAFGAFILALVLIPLRELTSASNLAFAFVVVTIVVAELGGRAPALVTAVVSAMSLNFFLTRPYLTLLIDDQDDVIAFLALLACGLVAAAFGRRRARSAEAARRSQAEIHALRDLVAGLEAGAPLDHVLDTLRGAFGLGRVVLRDGADRVLGAAPARPSPAPVPATELEPEMLLAQSDTRHTWARRGFRLPEGGGRLRLPVSGEPLFLDLWEGDQDGLGASDRRALALAGSILALELTRRRADDAGPR